MRPTKENVLQVIASGPQELEAVYIAAGMSLNRREYPPEVLKAAVNQFKGAPVYVDHPSMTEMFDRPERSIRDLAGVILEARYDTFKLKDGTIVEGVGGKIRIASQAAWVTQLFEEGIAGDMSIVAFLDGEDVEGPIDKPEDGYFKVTIIERVLSVDFVTTAAAKGQILNRVEAIAIDPLKCDLASLLFIDHKLGQALQVTETAFQVVESKTWVTETDDLSEESPACRKKGESKSDCVARKIPEIMKDDPTISQDQAIAMAESMCAKACGESEALADAPPEVVDPLPDPIPVAPAEDPPVEEPPAEDPAVGGEAPDEVSILKASVAALTTTVERIDGALAKLLGTGTEPEPEPSPIPELEPALSPEAFNEQLGRVIEATILKDELPDIVVKKIKKMVGLAKSQERALDFFKSGTPPAEVIKAVTAEVAEFVADEKAMIEEIGAPRVTGLGSRVRTESQILAETTPDVDGVLSKYGLVRQHAGK